MRDSIDCSGAAAAAALVPEVAEARDHVRGSGGPTLVVFGDYEPFSLSDASPLADASARQRVMSE
jgi:hypothetical protein